MPRSIEFLTMAVLFGLVGHVSAAEKVNLQVGDPAPVFEAKDDSGATWKSTDHVGRKFVVVYFYPADCTGGCTKQAQGFTKDLKNLADRNAVVVGVSGDSVENHVIFKQMAKLGLTLLADEQGEVAKKFGVPTAKGGEVKRPFEGKEVILKRGVSAERWTFVFGKDGKLIHKAKVTNAAGDSQEVLKIIDAHNK